MPKTTVAVVDGANVAFIERSQNGDPKVSNLIAVRKALQEKGFDPIIIVDAALVHKVDDPDQLEAMIDDQVVRQAPAGTDADFFVIKVAENEDGWIVSNDRYKDFLDDHPWINERRIPLMIVRGEVELYEEDEA